METEQPSPLGALLARTRKRARLTQEALAERAGVSVNTISNLEAGRGHLPRTATLDLLAEALASALTRGSAEQAGLRVAFREAASASRAPRQTAPPDGAAPPQEAPPPLPSGRLTFLVCAPVRAPADRPDRALARTALLTWWAARLRQVVPRHGGLLVDPLDGPDGAVCVFPHAGEAAAAACALQRALWERPARLRSPRGSAPLARAGADTAEGAEEAEPLCLALHTGWAEPGTGDYAGPSRRRATRLAHLGQAGQLLLTAATRELVGRSLPGEVRLHGAGQHSLSVVERPQPVYQLLPERLPDRFPPPRALPTPATNLPVQLTSFVGREREQVAVGALLAQAPLVTLVGAGGCGKTRLALAVAAELLEAYPDGVWLVELAALADPALAPQAVAAALGLREEPGRPLLVALSDHLQAKQLLLLLDNCEHLLAACAALTAALLRRCPHLRVLATSRERLGIGGERCYRVPSLALPAPDQPPLPAAPDAAEGVRLFVERARAGQPDFALTAENAGVVARICRRLDGLPLALELAAARVGSLPLEALAARLERSLGMLTEGPRDAPPRQQTLRATLDWSWALLGEPERVALRRLAVFRGGWEAEAAEAVCGGTDLGGWPVLGLLSGLVSKSLVVLQDGAGLGRYGLLETVRQYAVERLEAAGEEVAAQDRRLEWHLGLAEDAEPGLAGPEQGVWLGRLEIEHDNLRAALRWAYERGRAEAGLRLAGALGRFWELHGHLSEGRVWLERLLSSTERSGVATSVCVRALDATGRLACRQGDYARATALLEESVALARETEDANAIARALNDLGMVAIEQGDYARATALLEESLVLWRELGEVWGLACALNDRGIVADCLGDDRRATALLEESVALARETGDIWLSALTLDNLGQRARGRGDYARATALLEESLALRRELGDPWGLAGVLNNLGTLAHAHGDNGRATALLKEGLILAQELGDKKMIAYGLEDVASVVCGQGQPERAARLCGAAAALRETIGAPRPPNERASYESAIAAAHTALGDDIFTASWTAGQALSLERAIADALTDMDS